MPNSLVERRKEFSQFYQKHDAEEVGNKIIAGYVKRH
jgi:hypothetical protein